MIQVTQLKNKRVNTSINRETKIYKAFILFGRIQAMAKAIQWYCTTNVETQKQYSSYHSTFNRVHFQLRNVQLISVISHTIFSLNTLYLPL